MNPALAARVFLFSWPRHMNNWVKPLADLPVLRSMSQGEIDALAEATPLRELSSGDFDYSNLINLFTGNVGGCIGEISTVLLIIGGLFLIARKIITWHTPLSFIATVALFSALFPATIRRFSICWLRLCPGTYARRVFMATDYSTSPILGRGKLIRRRLRTYNGAHTLSWGYPRRLLLHTYHERLRLYYRPQDTPEKIRTGGAAHV